MQPRARGLHGHACLFACLPCEGERETRRGRQGEGGKERESLTACRAVDFCLDAYHQIRV